MRILVVGSVLFVVCAGGCGSGPVAEERPPFMDKIGKSCTVQFKRGDGLGSGANLPVPPTTGNINGASVNVSGKLRAVSGGWIAVETGQTEYCIPRESILLVQFDK
jgi:hypothetical protein